MWKNDWFFSNAKSFNETGNSSVMCIYIILTFFIFILFHLTFSECTNLYCARVTATKTAYSSLHWPIVAYTSTSCIIKIFFKIFLFQMCDQLPEKCTHINAIIYICKYNYLLYFFIVLLFYFWFKKKKTFIFPPLSIKDVDSDNKNIINPKWFYFHYNLTARQYLRRLETSFRVAEQKGNAYISLCIVLIEMISFLSANTSIKNTSINFYSMKNLLDSFCYIYTLFFQENCLIYISNNYSHK